MEIRGEKGICTVCKNDQRMILGHHLTYEPEVIIYLCSQCHLILHGLARLDFDITNTLIGWVKQYGKDWIGGGEKYHKGEYAKKVQREISEKYNQKHRSEAVERAKKYREKYPDRIKQQKEQYKKLHPNYAKEKSKKWRENNPELLKRQRENGKEKRENWRKQHPDKMREYQRKYMAKKKITGLQPTS